MPFLRIEPEMLDAAARELHSINTSVRVDNSFAMVGTTDVAAAAADVVSTMVAAQFSWHGKLFHEISAQAAAAREQFATMLDVSARSYVATEIANTTAVG